MVRVRNATFSSTGWVPKSMGTVEVGRSHPVTMGKASLLRHYLEGSVSSVTLDRRVVPGSRAGQR